MWQLRETDDLRFGDKSDAKECPGGGEDEKDGRVGC